MPTRNISLTDHLDRFVEANIEAGRYQNASEVMREALRLLEFRQREDELRLRRLEQALRIGEDAFLRGDYDVVEFDDIESYVESLGATGKTARA